MQPSWAWDTFFKHIKKNLTDSELLNVNAWLINSMVLYGIMFIKYVTTLLKVNVLKY